MTMYTFTTLRTTLAALAVAAATAAAVAPAASARTEVDEGTTVRATTTASRAAAPSYVTLLFGRTQWVQIDTNCRPRDGAVPLDKVAVDLTARGAKATGNVVVDRTLETSRLCFKQYTQHASWQDLASLRNNHGWSFVSAGATYGDMTQMTEAQQVAESCGSLTAFQAHGHNQAWGLFAYPNNKRTPTIQSTVVSKCFGYGRQYSALRNVRSTMKAPWFQGTRSVNGGRCNNTALPCATIRVPNDRVYTSPESLAQFVNVRPGEWAVPQFYRLVEGVSGGKTVFEWDCMSPDWRNHWTSNPELYCYNDFLSVVDAVPDAARFASPAAVATAWGRSLT
jgi:hypothetical protein